MENPYYRESEVHEASSSLNAQHYFVAREDRAFRQDFGIRDLQHICYTLAEKAGWWKDISMHLVPAKLMLIVSEIAEAMEGHRKNLSDEKIPARSAIEVELADAVIRIFDLAGRLELDIAGALLEKLQYNQTRADHKAEAREAAHGKSY